MAIWSPYGRGLQAFWNGLANAVPCRKEVTRFNVEHWVYRTHTAALIDRINSEDLGEAELSAMQLLGEVVDDVLAASGIEGDDLSPYEVAVCLGSSQSVTRVFADYLRGRRGETIAPDAFAGYSWISAGSLLSEVARRVNARGPALVVSTACASSTSSIGIAYDLIRQGRVRRAFAGGVGFFSELSFSGFNILRLTGREGCHPFDTNRDGMMFGDGFALVSLEDEDLARARGAQVLARVVGYASGNEAFHPTSPAPDGAAGFRVMWQALNRSPKLLSQLDYINAHGTGTLVNDAAELRAIQRLIEMRDGDDRVAVSSTKGHHGHALGAAGGVEFVATVLAIQNKMVPPTLGLENPEPGFESMNLVRGASHPQRIRIAISNSFAFGGNVASIAVEALDSA